MERISEEDLLNINALKTKAIVATSDAETAYAQALAAEAQAKYAILSLYMKYGLEPGKDQLLEDGTIVRLVKNDSSSNEQSEEVKENG